MQSFSMRDFPENRRYSIQAKVSDTLPFELSFFPSRDRPPVSHLDNGFFSRRRTTFFKWFDL